jgi:hypothetical protein
LLIEEIAMDETPTDLIRLMDVLKEYKPRRKWWEARIRAGDIVSYKVPGVRAIYLSRAEVERLLRPHALYIIPKPKEEPTQ